MDQAGVDAKGIAPIKPWLAEIKAAPSKTALAAEMAKLERMGVGGLFGSGVGPDDKDPTAYIAQFGQSGLGLPDRDYYLKSDDALAKIRPQYVAFVAKLLTLAGEPECRCARRRYHGVRDQDGAGALEPHRLARCRQDLQQVVARRFRRQGAGLPLAALSGRARARRAADLPCRAADRVHRRGGDFRADPALGAQGPICWSARSPAMPNICRRTIVAANFAFRGTVLSGTPENQVRWKRGVNLVSSEMGEAVGQDYVAAYFPPEAKAAADALVHNIIAAFGQRIRAVTWMDPATKQKALAKLAAFTPKIGYPTKWRDYSTLEIRPGDLVGNVARAEAFEFQRNLNKLGHPIDRTEWGMTPMEINAYANPVMNEIVFPAAILQPPFFDPKADPAVNYGGIGAVIGHELSHHFDDQGRKYDLTGKLTDWWTPQDVSRFTALTDELVKQYDAYEPLPGQHVQGALTLGENMADLNGLKTSYDAYKLSLGGKAAPVLDGFTGDERFYLGWAQVWRTKYREPQLRQQLLTDPHSPGTQRVDEVRNMDPWYKAFDVTKGETLYLAPPERVQVW